MAIPGQPTDDTSDPTNQPEPDRPDDAFIAEMVEEHPEARAYLQGFDDHADVIDMPVEHSPEVVLVFDRGQRRWTVTVATSGVIVIVRGALRGRPKHDRVVTTLDRDAARNLADALTWAVSIAEPRSLNL